ncbi:MAG: hypothetical protein IIZ61_08210, partial [Lachnospiraceae bacterium]|nr:hypothetical protein [Lachnospiraceae bacterium]
MSDDHGTGTGAAPGTGELETSKHVFTGPVFKQGEADSETVTSVTPAPITMIRSTAAPVSLKQQRLSRILNMRVKDLSEMTHKPEKTMFNPEEYKTFGSSYKNIGAGGNKRYNKIHGEDAALAQREDNAKKIEQAEMDADHWEMIRLRDTRSDVLLTEEEAKMLSAFLSGNALKDSMLIQGYKGDQNSRDEVLTAILEDFMSIDFDNYDISSDEAIAANALHTAGSYRAAAGDGHNVLDRHQERKIRLTIRGRDILVDRLHKLKDRS